MGRRTWITAMVLSLAAAWGAAPAWSACVTGTIGPSATVQGALDNTDCVAPDSTFYDAYNITLTTDGTLTIDQTSTEIDSFLLLFSGSNPDPNTAVPLATDDDGGTPPNSRIVQTLAAGTYTIVANSWAVETGSYTLTTSFQAAGGTTLDISGTWTVTETIDDSACGGSGALVETYAITVTQSGSNLTVATPNGTFSGTLSGTIVSWTGSFPDDGGTATITAMSVTINAAGTSGSGNASWSWTDGVDSCSGTTSVSLTKGTTNPGGLDVAGTWTVTETINDAACGGTGALVESYSITVTQTGNNLTVATPNGTFSGTLNGNTVSWTGSFPDDGGTTTITSMSVTINAAGTSGGGNASWSWTDGVDSCSGTTSTTLAKGTAQAGGGGGGGGGGGCFLQQVGATW